MFGMKHFSETCFSIFLCLVGSDVLKNVFVTEKHEKYFLALSSNLKLQCFLPTAYPNPPPSNFF